MPKRVTSRQANMVNDNMDMIVVVSDIISIISEVNLVGSNNSGWWVDTGVTRHVCADKSMFYSFRAVDNGEKLYMGNSAIADIKGEGDVVRSDRGRDYVSPFADLCEKHGIRHELTAPYSPEQNSIAERKNRTLKEMINAMLISSGLSQDMKGKAILTTTYLLNKIPRKEKEESPYELWMGRKPSYQYLRDMRQDQPEEEEVELRRSKRARTEKSFVPDFVSFMVENEPASYREAVTSLEGHQWKEAIKSEIDSILQNHTWELVDLPPGCKPLGYKWIFKKKMKADGTIDKYKARLVIKGCRQCEGLDYFDTYSPVTRITSIRMVLAIAALRNLEVHQMDVKTAFLNGDLEEEIYMN
ncbi:retrovirus-related pol polyprotein from transposon TNT 1-94 [Tanacetum coccineum]